MMNGCTVQVFVSALIAQTPGVLTTHAHGENLGCVQQQPRCCWTVSLMRLYADDACLGWLRAIIDALVQDLIRAPLPWALTRVTSADANGVPVTGQHSEEANTCLSSCWYSRALCRFSTGFFVFAGDDKELQTHFKSTSGVYSFNW